MVFFFLVIFKIMVCQLIDDVLDMKNYDNANIYPYPSAAIQYLGSQLSAFTSESCIKGLPLLTCVTSLEVISSSRRCPGSKAGCVPTILWPSNCYHDLYLSFPSLLNLIKSFMKSKEIMKQWVMF